MLSAVSTRHRAIVAALHNGDELIGALRALCREHAIRCGYIRGTGALAYAAVCPFDPATRTWQPPREIDGHLELVSLTGTIAERDGEPAIEVRAAVMRQTVLGLDLAGGRLTDARALAVDLVIDAFDDLRARRGIDEGTGIAACTELAPAADRTPAAAGAPVRSAGQTDRGNAPRSPASGDPGGAWDHDVQLHPGDCIDHPSFGRVTVLRVEGEQEYAHIRLRNGRTVRLSLDVIALVPAGTANGQRVFSARVDGSRARRR